MSGNKDLRTYQRADCAVFRKTAEAFGGLSNMAPGFPVRVNDVRILTVEALYQACRFPHRPEVQRRIIEQASPMTAKMVGKPYRDDSRPDWDRVRVKIMRWVLRIKLAMHWTKFSELLLSTGDQPIVEDSRKDDFWGAVPIDNTSLIGMNVLGRLLMELREEVKQGVELRHVEPPEISDFLLFDEILGVVDFRNDKSEPSVAGAKKEEHAVDDSSLPLFDDELVEAPIERLVDKLPPPAVKRRSGVIADLKPYAAYKDSGLAWLGLVPEHWEIKRAKSVFHCVDERSPSGKEELLTVSSARGIVPRKSAKVTMFKAESYVGYKLCWPGDLVVNSLWAWGGGLGVSQHHGIISSAYSVYRIRRDSPMTPGFVNKVVRSSSFNWELTVRSKGVWISRLQLTDIAFLDAPIYIPPPEEQAFIVRFLDWAKARLERTIRAKRRVIVLLAEQKQAIIHRAVTRGLDPTVLLKPSGISWLGDIPAHWDLQNLGRAVRLITGFPFASGGFSVLESDMRLVRGINVTPSGLRWNSVVRWKRTSGDGLDDFALQVGDIVLGMDRPIIGAGVRAASVEAKDVPSLLLQRVARLRPTAKLDANYLLLLLRGRLFADYMTPIFTGISVPHLSPEQIKGFKVPLPPVSEQQAIVKHVESETIGLNTAISRLHREIDLLREYRTRLVADVVTGKLDVREAAAVLPQDEVETFIGADALDADDDPDGQDESEPDDEEAAA